MPDNTDDLTEALKGLLGSTWKYTPQESPLRLSTGDGFILSPGPNVQGTIYLGKPDPIHPGNFFQTIPRAAAPDKSIFIQFEQDKVSVYEQDEYNSKHLRFSIPYTNINSILAVASNKLLTPDEVNLLEIIAELRSTQASLHETAVALRESKSVLAVSRDKEVARLGAELHVAHQRNKIKEQENFELRLANSDLQRELEQIKKEIADRKRAIAHLELFDA